MMAWGPPSTPFQRAEDDCLEPLFLMNTSYTIPGTEDLIMQQLQQKQPSTPPCTLMISPHKLLNCERLECKSCEASSTPLSHEFPDLAGMQIRFSFEHPSWPFRRFDADSSVLSTRYIQTRAYRHHHHRQLFLWTDLSAVRCSRMRQSLASPRRGNQEGFRKFDLPWKGYSLYSAVRSVSFLYIWSLMIWSSPQVIWRSWWCQCI